MKLKIIGTALLLTIASLPERAIAQFGLDRSDFFERGTEQMEREIERLESPPIDPSFTINERALPSEWKEFLFSEAGFSIWMPLGNVTESTEILETTAGTIELKVFATNPQLSRFIVAYSDPLHRSQLENPETIFDRVRKLMSGKNTEFELLSDRPLELDNYPVNGRELSLKNSHETIAFRIYLLHKRLYILASTRPNADLHNKSFTFFNSFQLTTDN